MRKRKKKQIAVKIDEDGSYVNCYGRSIGWTKKELSRARSKARKLAKLFRLREEAHSEEG